MMDSQKHAARTGRDPRPLSGRRLNAAVREQQIVQGAIQFFAEHGFEGRTRDLAEELGVTQPLLYRYFPTKQSLIERVFREVYLKPLESDLTSILCDRAKPLEQRLESFYIRYGETINRYEWTRIYIYAGLKGEDLNKSYTELVETKILRVICAELRAYCGLPGPDAIPISELELEHVWTLHGGLFYYSVRKHIYGARVSEDVGAIVRRTVAVMLEGTKAVAGKR